MEQKKNTKPSSVKCNVVAFELNSLECCPGQGGGAGSGGKELYFLDASFQKLASTIHSYYI
ncbi:MAG: hypothetical protein QM530_01175 [Phycisphaerales bacterium]|nr:hypothetical protein [Phycisphaerales bacterium]